MKTRYYNFILLISIFIMFTFLLIIKPFNYPTQYQIVDFHNKHNLEEFIVINSIHDYKTDKIKQGPLEVLSMKDFIINIPIYKIEIPSNSKLLINKGDVISKEIPIYKIDENMITSPYTMRLVEVLKEDKLKLLFENLDEFKVEFRLRFNLNFSLKNIQFYYYDSFYQKNFLNIDKIVYDKFTYEYVFTLSGFIVNKYFFNKEKITIYSNYFIDNHGLYLKDDFINYDPIYDKYYVNILLHSPEKGYGYVREYVNLISQVNQFVTITGNISEDNIVLKLD